MEIFEGIFRFSGGGEHFRESILRAPTSEVSAFWGVHFWSILDSGTFFKWFFFRSNGRGPKYFLAPGVKVKKFFSNGYIFSISGGSRNFYLGVFLLGGHFCGYLLDYKTHQNLL